MSFFPKGFSPPVTQKNIAYLHILLTHCTEQYPQFTKADFKKRLKEKLQVEHISDINYNQLQEAITILTNALKAKNPNYKNN